MQLVEDQEYLKKVDKEIEKLEAQTEDEIHISFIMYKDYDKLKAKLKDCKGKTKEKAEIEKKMETILKSSRRSFFRYMHKAAQLEDAELRSVTLPPMTNQ